MLGVRLRVLASALALVVGWGFGQLIGFPGLLAPLGLAGGIVVYIWRDYFKGDGR